MVCNCNADLLDCQVINVDLGKLGPDTEKTEISHQTSFESDWELSTAFDGGRQNERQSTNTLYILLHVPTTSDHENLSSDV